MMNIYNTFPWEVYVKIAFLDASIVTLNSQVGNSDLKKKIRKLPPQQFFPIKMDFFKHLEALKARRVQTKTLPFPTCSNTFREEACASISSKYSMRMWHGSQGCREKLHFQQIKLCSCVLILQNNPNNLYLVSVSSEGVWWEASG